MAEFFKWLNPYIGYINLGALLIYVVRFDRIYTTYLLQHNVMWLDHCKQHEIDPNIFNPKIAFEKLSK